MVWKVYFFQKARGNCPVKDFIEDLDKPTFARTLRHIKLLREYGPHLSLPYSKKLTNSLYELRVSGKATIRIIYTMRGGVYYLLHGFKKKTNKTPRREIKT